MNAWVQGMLGAGVCIVVFAAGFGLGQSKASPAQSLGSSGAPEIRVVMPDRMKVELSGLESDRTACLEWVSRNFKEPNVGQLAMICGAGVSR